MQSIVTNNECRLIDDQTPATADFKRNQLWAKEVQKAQAAAKLPYLSPAEYLADLERRSRDEATQKGRGKMAGKRPAPPHNGQACDWRVHALPCFCLC